MAELWNSFLYQPVFNLLIWIYNNFTDQNMGWAVVYLTVLLRLALLPFTLITEKTNVDNLGLEKQVEQIEKEFRQDPVQKKNEIRKVLRKRKFRPWAKVVTIGVQLLVLILLYKVFMHGITGRNLIEYLYPSIDFPGKINTNFYGFELGQAHTLFWPFLVAFVLFLEIYLGYKRNKTSLNQGHLAYIVIFPLFSFLALWYLPMVKSLFVLTSIVFSDIIHQFSLILFKDKTKGKDQH